MAGHRWWTGENFRGRSGVDDALHLAGRREWPVFPRDGAAHEPTNSMLFVEDHHYAVRFYPSPTRGGSAERAD